jgi:hypothetical protein
MAIRTLGVDVGIRAAHVATLCDERGVRVTVPDRRSLGRKSVSSA